MLLFDITVVLAKLAQLVNRFDIFFVNYEMIKCFHFCHILLGLIGHATFMQVYLDGMSVY